jgi:hypothetical protein
MKVAVGGIDVTVGSGTAVSVGETTVTAGVHEVKISAMSKTALIFLTFIDSFLCNELPNGFALLAAGGEKGSETGVSQS